MVVNYGGAGGGGAGVTQDQLVNALTGDFRFDNQYALITTTRIIVDTTPVPLNAPGVYTIMNDNNPTINDYLDHNGNFLKNAVGVTIEVAGTATDLVRFEYEGNDIDVKGVGIHNLTANGWVKASKSGNGSIDVTSKYNLLITDQIITNTDTPTSEGVYTFTDVSNSAVSGFRFTRSGNDYFNESGDGVTLQRDSSGFYNLIRYEYFGNDIEVKGVGLYHYDSTNGWIQINAQVPATELSLTVKDKSVKYIKVTSTGAVRSNGTIDSANNIVEIQAFDKDDMNVALLAVDFQNADSTLTPLISSESRKAYNGNLAPDEFVVLSNNSTGVGSGILTLNKVYQVERVVVFRDYDTGKTYNNTKIEVSEDGTNWTLLSDGTDYIESRAGKEVLNPGNDELVTKNLVNYIDEAITNNVPDLTDNFQYDNKHNLPIVGEIITDSTVPTVPGVYTFTYANNPILLPYVDTVINQSAFKNMASGVTIQYNSMTGETLLIRYEYIGNDIDLKGEGIYHFESESVGWKSITAPAERILINDTDTSSHTENLADYITEKTAPAWIEYATDGEYVDGYDIDVTSPKPGTRMTYTYNGTNIYRFDPTDGTQSDSAFYKDEQLTVLLAARAPDGGIGGIGYTKVDRPINGSLTEVFNAAQGTDPHNVVINSQLDSVSANDRNRANHVGTQSLDTITETADKKILTADERIELLKIANKANETGDDTVRFKVKSAVRDEEAVNKGQFDTALANMSTRDRDRANHTGTQSIDTITESATRKIMTANERTIINSISAVNSGIQTTDKYSRPNSDIIISESKNAFSIEEFTLTSGSTLTLENDVTYKIIEL